MNTNNLFPVEYRMPCLKKENYETNYIPAHELTAEQFLDLMFMIRLNKLNFFLENEDRLKEELQKDERYKYCVKEFVEYYRYFVYVLDNIERVVKNTNFFNNLKYDKIEFAWNTGNAIYKKYNKENKKTLECKLIYAIAKEINVKEKVVLKKGDKIIDFMANASGGLLPITIYSELFRIFFGEIFDNQKFQRHGFYSFFKINFPVYQKRSAKFLLNNTEKIVQNFKKQLINDNDYIQKKYPKLRNLVIEQSILLAYLYELADKSKRKIESICNNIKFIEDIVKKTWEYDFFNVNESEKVIQLTAKQAECIISRIEKVLKIKKKTWSGLERSIGKKNLKRDLSNIKTFYKFSDQELKKIAEYLEISEEYLLGDTDNWVEQRNSNGEIVRPVYRKIDDHERFISLIDEQFFSLNNEDKKKIIKIFENDSEILKNIVK